MKFFLLIIALCVTAYCQEEEVNDEDLQNLSPEQLAAKGYVLQPDGSYLMTIVEPGQTQDETKTETVNGGGEGSGGYGSGNTLTQNFEYDDDEYREIDYENNVITVKNGNDRSYFKINRGSPNNENDYSVDAINSPSNPIPITSTDSDSPAVYPQGSQGDPDYSCILGSGKGPNRSYLKMVPDSSRPSGFKYITQYISGWKPGEATNAPEPPAQVAPDNEPLPEDAEEDDSDTDQPNLNYRNGYLIVSVTAPNKRFFKITPSNNKNPYDFGVEAIKSPEQPNSKPDDDDDEGPEVIPEGTRGQPDYKPILSFGNKANRLFLRLIVNPDNPRKYRFVSEDPQLAPGEVQTEPPEEQMEYEDEPPNVNHKVLNMVGMQNHIISGGHPHQKFNFRISRKSARKGDCEVRPIRSENELDSSPDPNDINAPEVLRQGDPEDPDNAPIVAIGPKFKRQHFRMLLVRGRARFLPLARYQVKGQWRYRLRRRRWHYRTQYRHLLKRINRKPRRFTRRIVRRCKWNCGGIRRGGGIRREGGGIRQEGGGIRQEGEGTITQRGRKRLVIHRRGGIGQGRVIDHGHGYVHGGVIGLGGVIGHGGVIGRGGVIGHGGVIGLGGGGHGGNIDHGGVIGYGGVIDHGGGIGHGRVIDHGGVIVHGGAIGHGGDIGHGGGHHQSQHHG